MPDRLDACLERDYWISFAGNVTYKANSALRDAARRVPAERLLVETDAPYLSPEAVRKERNQPANVVLTAECVAAERGVSYAELEAQVERNAAELFGW
jgi:TatD DNase family protein